MRFLAAHAGLIVGLAALFQVGVLTAMGATLADGLPFVGRVVVVAVGALAGVAVMAWIATRRRGAARGRFVLALLPRLAIGAFAVWLAVVIVRM